MSLLSEGGMSNGGDGSRGYDGRREDMGGGQEGRRKGRVGDGEGGA